MLYVLSQVNVGLTGPCCMIAGNKITLHTRPNARGIDIREELLRFYNKQYSAGLMCLTVYGKGNSFMTFYSAL